VSENASLSMRIASRYARAIFELARESDALDRLEADMAALDALLAGNADFGTLIRSPLVSRVEAVKAIEALAPKLGLGDIVTRTLLLMATKGRLFVLPALVAEVRRLLAEAKGEITAEIVSAKALTKAQSEKLEKVLAKATGKNVKLDVAVDEDLIGGLVVKVGSKMVDGSIRSKLAALRNAMKEVG